MNKENTGTNNMNKILVTTDFSGNSKAGIRFAVQLATQAGAEIEFYHVVELLRPTSWNDFRYQSFTRSKIRLFTSRLESFVRYACSGELPAGMRINYCVEVGEPVTGLIIARSRKIKADVVCMSTKGAGRIKKVMGTHASAMVTASAVPVIVVPGRYRVHPIESVLYASDFESLGHELNKLKRVLAPLKPHTHVCHFDYLMDVPGNIQKIAKRSSSHEAPDVTFTFRKRSIDDTLAEDIRKEVGRKSPDVLVLFTKTSRNWFERIFVPSESRDVAFKPTVPVLILRKTHRG